MKRSDNCHIHNEKNVDHKHIHQHETHTLTSSKILYVVLLNLLITGSEFVGGLISRSLALLSDSMHNLSDVSSIIISYFAHKISKKSADERNTFGYKRAKILAAFINSTVLMIIVAFLTKEAIERLINPQIINAKIVLIIGGIGLFSNVLSMLFLKPHSSKDINIKSSYLHMLSDSLSSVAVIIGSVMVHYFKIYRIDPILTIGIAFYIGKESVEMFLKTLRILMQSSPEDINIDEVVEEIRKIPEVENVHHVHIWNLDDNIVFFEAHVNLKTDMNISTTMVVQKGIEKILIDFGINHVTLQFEHNGCPDCNVISHRANH
ncbi:MAG: cation diffusion facilitator family transporter [Fervidobacterium sp.]|nr:cation diffusion facilitator family transporter [Fervidobacterium sp.]